PWWMTSTRAPVPFGTKSSSDSGAALMALRYSSRCACLPSERVSPSRASWGRPSRKLAMASIDAPGSLIRSRRLNGPSGHGPYHGRQGASAGLIEGARRAPKARTREANLAPENAWLSGILLAVRETFRNAYFTVMVDDTRRLIRRARTEQ